MLREHVYGLLAGDAGMNTLGIASANLFANGAGDSAQGQTGPYPDLFAVLRWLDTTAALPGERRAGRARETEVQLWVYTRFADYAPHDRILKRFQEILDNQCGVIVDGDGTSTLLDSMWNGEGPDGFDDGYQRYTRYGSFMLISTGK